LQQPTDELHSRITRVRLTVDGSHIDLAVPVPNGEGVSIVTLPAPLSGTRLDLTVLATEARTTVDRRFAETTELPVSIRELSAPGVLAGGYPQGDLAPFCQTGLLTLDGAPIGVQLDDGDMANLAQGSAVHATLCDGPTIRLEPGTHLLSTSNGTASGIDVDRVVLSSGDAAPAVDPAVTVARTLTTRTATVAPCPTGCWLVMGEGWNPGWTASAGGRSLGAPQQVDGGFNGWWLPATISPTVVEMEWTAQRPVTLALAASGATVLLCLYLVFRRPRLPLVAGSSGWTADPPQLDRVAWAPRSFATSLIAGVAVVLLTALVAAPSTALYALAPAVLVVVFRRPRIAAAAAAALTAFLAARVVRIQLANRYPANAAWPGFFEKLHRPGMLVVVLLLVAVVADRDDQ
jgi:arabinofuranan 3-O-arabinosyltransferase